MSTNPRKRNRLVGNPTAGQPAKLAALPDAKDAQFLERVKERLEVREGSRGSPYEAVVTKRDLAELKATLESYASRVAKEEADAVPRPITPTPRGGGTTIELTELVRDIINRLQAPISLDHLRAEYRRLKAKMDDLTSLSEQSVVAVAAREAIARRQDVSREVNARNEQIAIESRQRLDQIQATADATLRSVIATHQERINREVDVATARFDLSTQFQEGILAEANARLELTAVVNQNVAAILSEQTARADADSAIASDVTTLFAQVEDNTAAILNEQTVRADADSAEASARNLLAAQIRGGYTGTDPNMVTTGLIYEERIARATADSALAESITLLSAGAGEQFDWQTIWYFDAGVESWTGNGTPTASASGWLRPANQASGAYVESPAGVGADAVRYGQVRLRLRKVGAPTFAGFLWWRAPADGTWETSRRVALTEPTWDSNGIGLVTVSPEWTGTIDRIRVDASSAQTATDYFEYDWIAVGRPSPGASSAQLLEEQQVRATADLAEATARETLSAVLTGAEDPTGLTLPTLTSGLIFDERQARATQDGALASSISSLQATVTSNNTTLSSAITTEAAARADGDAAEAADRESLAVFITGAADPAGLTVETLSSGLIWQEREARVTAVSSVSSLVTGLTAQVGDLEADLQVVQEVVTGSGSSVATQLTALVSSDREAREALDQLAEANLRSVLAVEAERTDRVGAVAVALQTVQTEIQAGLLAEATARQLLSVALDNTNAAVAAESLARATQDEAFASQFNALQATVDGNTADILSEQTVRATADTALANSITILQAEVDDANAAILNEQTVRANADAAEAAARTLLAAELDGNIAAVEVTASATADRTAGLAAEYFVKVQAGNKVAGYALAASEDPTGTSESAFIVLADKFAVVTGSDTIADPKNPPADRIPFSVDGSGVYINGQLRVNAGGPSLNTIASQGANFAANIFRSAATIPATPTGGSFNFATNALTVPAGWSATQPTATTTPVWTARYVFSGAPGSTATGGTWSTPVIVAQVGANGTNGTNGTNGIRGTVDALATGTSWSDALADATILGYTGSSLRVIGDRVTISGVGFAQTRAWDGSAWVTIGAFINGNLVVDGTIIASKLAAGSVTADKINVTNLQAVDTNTGSLTVDGALTLSSTGKLQSGKTAYGSGTGWIFEHNSGTPRFDIGNSAQYVRWSGSQLLVGGDIIATGNIQANAVTETQGYAIPSGGANVTTAFGPYIVNTSLGGLVTVMAQIFFNVTANSRLRVRIHINGQEAGRYYTGPQPDFESGTTFSPTVGAIVQATLVLPPDQNQCTWELFTDCAAGATRTYGYAVAQGFKR